MRKRILAGMGDAGRLQQDLTIAAPIPSARLRTAVLLQTGRLEQFPPSQYAQTLFGSAIRPTDRTRRPR